MNSTDELPLLVIDAGTSSVRASAVDAAGRIVDEERRETPPHSPMPGLVEFDANELARAAIELSSAVIQRVGPVAGVGVSAQRASAIVWDRDTGEPLAPAQSWQDLRTVGECLTLRAEGIRLAPNQPATKFAAILAELDSERDVCVGTPDSWLLWTLTGGSTHATDLTNAAISGLLVGTEPRWDSALATRLGIGESSLPRIVPSSGFVADASALPGSPPILGVAGDQMASLIGQSCVRPGMAKATFGTGGMLDLCRGTLPPPAADRADNGTFPIVCWQRDDEIMFGLEAIMLAAGTNVAWLTDDLGIVGRADDTAELAWSLPSNDGVAFVPALLGLGTPYWDYGARATLLGATRGTTTAHLARAVLEGVAHRGADLLAAAEADSGLHVERLRIDGGMAANSFFTTALATAIDRPVEVAPVKEATSLGAAYLAGLANGSWSGWDQIESLWTPSATVTPDPERVPMDRERWIRAIDAARGWYADLSAIDF